jgi:hypothetical protein
MAVEHDVVRVVVEISPKNPGDSAPDSFEEQLKTALAAQNSGAHDDWRLIDTFEVPVGSQKKSYILVFERETA